MPNIEEKHTLQSPTTTELSTSTFDRKEVELFELDIDGDDEDLHRKQDVKNYSSRIRKARLYMFFTKKDLPWLIVGCIATVLGALAPAISAILMGRVFEVLSSYIKGDYDGFGDYMNHIRTSTTSIIIMGAACVVPVWVTISCWMQIGESQGLKARKNILETFITKPISWYEENDKVMGDLIQINRCVEELRAGSSEATALFLQSIVCICALLGTSIYYSWSVTLVMLASAPLIAIFAYIFARLTEKFTALENKETAKAAKILDWSLTSSKLVKLFSTQHLEFEKFGDAVLLSRKAFFKLILVTSANMGVMRFIMLCMFVQGFWFGSSEVRKGNLDSGNVLTCFASCLMLGETLKAVLPQIVTMQKAKVAIDRIQQFVQARKSKTIVSKFNTEIALRDTKNISIYPEVCHGDIKFKNVEFAYPTRFESKVLKNVSIHFPAGRTTFLVGRSGSGKSTLSSLLLKFYAPNKGRVEIDGFSVSDLNTRWLTDNITLVEQTCTLFKDTIKNNILMGKVASGVEDITEDQLKEASQLALLTEVIHELEDGLNTIVGPNGIALSGGQQQRVALARARIRDTPILILDESVSALDIVLRELIIAAIKKWRVGKTTIILTHEYSQIGKEDYVYLMENGVVAEHGVREVLENGDGLFQKLISLQATTVERIHGGEKISTSKPLFLPLEKNPRYSVMEKAGSRLSTQLLASINPLSFLGSNVEHEDNINDMLNRRICRRRRVQEDVPVESALSEKDLEKGEQEEESKDDDRPKITPILTIIKKMYQTVDKKAILFLGLLFSVLNGAVNPIFSYTFSKLLSGIVPQNDDVGSPHYLLKWSLIVIFLALFDGITTFVKEFLLHYSSEIWIYSLRKRAFNAISQQGMTWFGERTNAPAEVSALLMNDARDLRSLVSQFLGIVSTASILASLGLIWALVTGWKLSLVCLSLVPLFIITSGAYASFLQNSENEYKNAVAELENQTYETVEGIKTIRVLRLERYFIQKFHERAEHLQKVSRKRSILTGMGVAVTNLLTFVTQGILLYYGMQLVGKGEYTSSELMETFVLLIFSIMSCVQLINEIPDISRGQRAATYIFRLLDLEASKTETIGSEVPQAEEETIVEFNNMKFAYPSLPDHKVLKGLSLKIQKGEHIAVIGESGSGKSTLTLLLTRLFDVPEDSLFFESVDINSLDIKWVRSVIALVDQKANFFDGTIRENISYGLQNVSDSDIIDTLKLANIYDFVISLPEGLDSRIDTSLISGGQAQRLSIARALIRNPRLLILDECTSALDSEGASKFADLIQNNLKRRSDMTVLMITHSEDMMKVADKVVTMRSGTICEQGSFDELFNRRGELFRIVTAGMN